VRALAKASRANVLRAWQGLGYNRRALHLHATSKQIAQQTRFPRALEGLQSLPGVGLYTASAVLAFSFNKDVPVVDVNVQRVLSRLWKPMKDTHSTLPLPEIVALDREILPRGHSSAWHEALMDHGSTICTKLRPRCEECPVRSDCPSARYLRGIVLERNASTSAEERFFRHPRRIWRGRVLKIIADANGISRAQLLQRVAEDYRTDPADWSDLGSFVRSILASLKEEGFIAAHKGRLTLADGND
jgi:A/G-specific adenine glycosylase